MKPAAPVTKTVDMAVLVEISLSSNMWLWLLIAALIVALILLATVAYNIYGIVTTPRWTA
jgi:uncharacterized protein (DUF983 family)